MNKIKEKKEIFIISIITGIISYFYFFTKDVMAPDMVYYNSLHIAGDWEASLGRWGIQLIDNLRKGMINPFLITLVCILCVAVATIFLINTLEIDNKIASILIAIILMTSPHMAETLLFTFTADSYFVAVLLSCLGAYCISKSKCVVKNYVLAAICFIFTLSFYQAYIGLIVGLVFLIFFKKILEDEETGTILKWFFINIFFILACLVLYYIITNIYLRMNNLELASYRGASSFGLETFLQLPNTIGKAYREFIDYLFGERIIYNGFWKRNIMNVLLLIMMFCSLIYQIYKKKIYQKKVRLLALIVGLLVFPVALNVIDLIMPQTNINLVTGYAMILVYVLMLIVMEDGMKQLFIPSSVIMVVLSVTFLLSNTATYMARYDVFQNYYAESSRILTKVELLEDYTTDKEWMFSDNIRYVSDYTKLGNGFISNNYMTWTAATGIWLNEPFYKKYFGKDIKMVSYAKHNEILNSKEYLEMGVYPAANSIKIIDNVIVIKLSEKGSYVQ